MPSTKTDTAAGRHVRAVGGLEEEVAQDLHLVAWVSQGDVVTPPSFRTHLAGN